jgi:flagellar protein FliO/FliZ
LDTVFLALRVVVALGAVFGALLFAHRWVTKGRPGSKPRNRQIEVVARQSLGAKAGIAVVDAGGRRYLLGVTEHAVTVLDTLGAAEALTGEPELVASQPIAAARFEEELRTVTIATADVPIVVRGAADPHDPSGPMTQTISIMPAAPGRPVGPRTEAIRLPGRVTYTASNAVVPAAQPVYSSRRAALEAEQQAAAALEPSLNRRPAAQGGALAGSLLAPSTWKQTFDALKKLR